MGTRLRFFIVDDSDAVQRIPMTRYHRMMERDPNECFASYAGKRIRCAMVALETEGRIPLYVLRTDYYFLTFDSEGLIDTTLSGDEGRLVADMLPPILESDKPENVVDAKSHFARKRYKQEYLWTPSPEIENSIVIAIFGENPAR